MAILTHWMIARGLYNVLTVRFCSDLGLYHNEQQEVMLFYSNYKEHTYMFQTPIELC
jgi:hypothetical protein